MNKKQEYSVATMFLITWAMIIINNIWLTGDYWNWIFVIGIMIAVMIMYFEMRKMK